jgi:hypothetical protein
MWSDACQQGVAEALEVAAAAAAVSVAEIQTMALLSKTLSSTAEASHLHLSQVKTSDLPRSAALAQVRLGQDP